MRIQQSCASDIPNSPSEPMAASGIAFNIPALLSRLDGHDHATSLTASCFPVLQDLPQLFQLLLRPLKHTRLLVKVARIRLEMFLLHSHLPNVCSRIRVTATTAVESVSSTTRALYLRSQLVRSCPPCCGLVAPAQAYQDGHALLPAVDRHRLLGFLRSLDGGVAT